MERTTELGTLPVEHALDRMDDRLLNDVREIELLLVPSRRMKVWTRLIRPGHASILIPNDGTENAWMTSVAVTRNLIWVPQKHIDYIQNTVNRMNDSMYRTSRERETFIDLQLTHHTRFQIFIGNLVRT